MGTLESTAGTIMTELLVAVHDLAGERAMWYTYGECIRLMAALDLPGPDEEAVTAAVNREYESSHTLRSIAEYLDKLDGEEEHAL